MCYRRKFKWKKQIRVSVSGAGILLRITPKAICGLTGQKTAAALCTIEQSAIWKPA